MIYIKIKKLLQPLNKNNDFMTKNDLYVEVEFNGITKRTRTIIIITIPNGMRIFYLITIKIFMIK